MLVFLFCKLAVFGFDFRMRQKRENMLFARKEEKALIFLKKFPII